MANKFDIQKIQNHEKGWEKEWGQLLEALLLDKNHEVQDEEDDLLHWGPLGRACQGLLKSKEENKNLDDFISFVIEQYLHRVENQTLFGRYDEEKGDPIAYLCSFQYLHVCLKKFRTEHLRFLSLNETDESEDGLETSILPDPGALTPEMKIVQNKLHRLYQSLTSAMVIHCPKVGSRLYEQVGLHLYPKLSTKDEQMVRLHDDTRKNIAEIHTLSAREADSLILDKHWEDSMKLEERILELNVRLKADRYRTDENREQDRQRVLNLSKKLIFSPLSNATLEYLLQMSGENVARCLSRYIEKLPELFDGYQKIYDQIAIQEGEAEDE
ncbi:MAG: hypothetical protein K6C40_09520 [Thermoguttaceae bacterium]|nr:hypothetical protein [Thermoguttaceae bacterium]